MGKETTAGFICKRIARRAPVAALLATTIADPQLDKLAGETPPSLWAAGTLFGADILADVAADCWSYCTNWGKEHPMIVYGATKLAPIATGVTLCLTSDLEVGVTVIALGGDIICDGLGSLWQHCFSNNKEKASSHHSQDGDDPLAAELATDTIDEEHGLAVSTEPNNIAHFLTALSLSDSTLITKNITRPMLFKQQAHRLSPEAIVFTALTLHFAKNEELTHINTEQCIKELKELGLDKLTYHEKFITLYPAAFMHRKLRLHLVEGLSPATLNITREELVEAGLSSLTEQADGSLVFNIKDLVNAVEARFTTTHHTATASATR